MRIHFTKTKSKRKAQIKKTQNIVCNKMCLGQIIITL